jgi:hypothetical protein
MLRERERNIPHCSVDHHTGRFDFMAKVIFDEIQSLTRMIGNVVSVRYDYMTIKEKKTNTL